MVSEKAVVTVVMRLPAMAASTLRAADGPPEKTMGRKARFARRS